MFESTKLVKNGILHKLNFNVEQFYAKNIRFYKIE